MPDGNVSVPDVEDDIDFTVRVACECYCSIELAQVALAQQPDCRGALVWAAPCVPEPDALIQDAELVIIVADKASFPKAIARLEGYKRLGEATLLVCLEDEDRFPPAEIPGLVMPRSQLPTALSCLVQALIAPVIPRGLICVDWGDTRQVLMMEGQVIIEKASGSEPQGVIASVVSRLREQASGRVIKGVQASISCSTNNLKVRFVHDLISACETVTDEDATLIAAAPILDWPDSEHFEVRLFARVETAAQV